MRKELDVKCPAIGLKSWTKTLGRFFGQQLAAALRIGMSSHGDPLNVVVECTTHDVPPYGFSYSSGSMTFSNRNDQVT